MDYTQTSQASRASALLCLVMQIMQRAKELRRIDACKAYTGLKLALLWRIMLLAVLRHRLAPCTPEDLQVF